MQHGMYFTSQSELLELENEWLDGEQIDFVTTTYSASRHSVGGITWDGAQSLSDTFGSHTNRTLNTVYYMGDSRSDYPSVISGDHDHHFRGFAQDLIDLDLADAHIRINPEFNLTWSSRYPDDPQDYADAYARCVREMTSVDGAEFTFLFSPAGNRWGIADESWPVDSSYWPTGVEPPLIAPSKYDAWSQYPDSSDAISEEEWDQLRQESWEAEHQAEVDQWADFNDQFGGSGLCFPEWGCGGIEEWSNPGGGDNPWFIQQMHAWMDQHNVVFQTYWNGDSHGHSLFNPTQNPRAADETREWMRADILSGDDPTNGDTGDTDREYGGYQQPEPGTLDWHEPLNQNFADIEADVIDLARRISELE